MRLYLVRHGDALAAQQDPRRPLSPRGRKEVRHVAERLRAGGWRLPEVRHSDRLRAVETAALLVEVAGGGPLCEVEGLGPDDPVGALATQLAGREEDLALVGHLPFMGVLAQELLGSAARFDQVRFVTAGLLLLERRADGTWKAIAQLAPE